MPTYGYRALDTAGHRRRGILEADDPRAARRKLADQGLLAERVAPVHSASGAPRQALRRPARRALIYRELAALLRAGLTLERSLAMLAAMPELNACRHGLAVARDRVREGAGPADAWAEAAPIDPLESAALAAGERSGTLDVALERLATLLDYRVRVRSRIVSALIYPMVVAGLGAGVAIAMLGFMLPSFLRVWSEAGVELPWITRAVSSGGRILGILAVPLALAAAAGAAVPPLRKGIARVVLPRVRSRIDRLGFLSRPGRALAVSRFARTLALLLRGGVPVVDALPLAGRATGRGDIAAAVEVLADEVRHGLPLAHALRRIPVLSDSLAPWVEAGEAAGELAEMLDRAAEREQDAWERGFERILSLIEPALILVLGAFVLLLALAILMPILSLHGL